MVSPAAKKAHLRMALFIATLVSGVLLFAGLASVSNVVKLPSWLIISAAVAIGLGTILGSLWVMRGGKTTCPKCSSRSARFTYDNYVEYLSCSFCDFNEKTGYTMGNDI